VKRNTRIALTSVLTIVALGAAGVAAVSATNGDAETDTPITGADLELATQSALESTGGGRVTGTEIGDEESYYEVEVTLDDGSQVDVQLDEQFRVVGASPDVEDDEANDDDD
jgi:uncharacterized membrane protein YkoI